MAESRSFKEYVAYTFDNQFWSAAEDYLTDNFDSLDIELHRIHKAGAPEIQDVNVDYVWINDMPGMQIQFDVLIFVKYTIPEADYHYDNEEEKDLKLMVRCQGDLDCELDNFEIFEVSEYVDKNRLKNPMDDALVPVIKSNNLDAVAEKFLRDHYKKALLEPTWVDPLELAKTMGLTVKFVFITKDKSIFGRSFFYDCDTELYNPETDSVYMEHVVAGVVISFKIPYFIRFIKG